MAAAQQAFLSMLDPADVPLAEKLVDDARGRMGPQGTEWKLCEVGTLCNIYLVGLALARDVELLDKAFGYLDRFRSGSSSVPQEKMKSFPTNATRVQLLWACGHTVRSIRTLLWEQQEQEQEQQEQQQLEKEKGDREARRRLATGAAAMNGVEPLTSLPPSISRSYATMGRYCGLAEGLFEEYLASAPYSALGTPTDPALAHSSLPPPAVTSDQPLPRGERGGDGVEASMCERQTATLLNAMVCMYAEQADGACVDGMGLPKCRRGARPGDP